MKFLVLQLSKLCCFSLLGLAILAACGGPVKPAADSPSEAYKRLFAAVKNKDTEAVKKELSKKSLGLAEMSAQRFNKSLAQSIENGLTATTFSDTLPSLRDERIKDNMGAVEIWNSKDNKWEDVPFIFEDGAWKLAIGDGFAGSWQSPGPGRDRREKEAANAIFNNNVVIPGNTVNANRPRNAK
jgi:hypothetical protein